MTNPIDRRGRPRGYSVTELLVVIAIIGLISLVAVPQFMTMYRGSKMKSAVRTFTTRLRSAQQLAVSRNVKTEIRFKINTNQYTIWTQTTDPATYQLVWTQLGAANALEDLGTSGSPGSVYFQDTEFDLLANGWNIIDFNPNGTIVPPAAPRRSFLTIHTDEKISKPTYKVDIGATGTITVS